MRARPSRAIGETDIDPVSIRSSDTRKNDHPERRDRFTIGISHRSAIVNAAVWGQPDDRVGVFGFSGFLHSFAAS